MSERDDDLAKLAGLMGWMLNRVGKTQAFDPDPDGTDLIEVPAPDAPLPEQMAFVGHLAVALAGPNPKSNTNVLVEYLPGTSHYRVLFNGVGSFGDDLAWAACRAAIAAKGGAT